MSPLGPQSCLCLAWSPPSRGRPEEQQVAAGYSDGTLRVFSVSQIAMELKMRPHRAALTAIAFSADGEGWGPTGGQGSPRWAQVIPLGWGQGLQGSGVWPCLA